MAKATKVTSDYEMELTLSRRECEVLLKVLRAIGGSPTTTARGITAEIEQVLVAAGVKSAPDKTRDGDSIYFV